MKLTSNQGAFGRMEKKCVAKYGIGSYFCQGQCVYNNGTEYDHLKHTITVDCGNPKQTEQVGKK